LYTVYKKSGSVKVFQARLFFGIRLISSFGGRLAMQGKKRGMSNKCERKRKVASVKKYKAGLSGRTVAVASCVISGAANPYKTPCKTKRRVLIL
jgi:hypothetical protein